MDWAWQKGFGEKGIDCDARELVKVSQKNVLKKAVN